MYSRFPKPSEEPIRIPDHYSGCAFSEDRKKPEEDTPQPRSEGGRDPSSSPQSTQPPSQADHRPNPPAELPAPPSEKPFLSGGLPMLGGALGFEELLLMGLILLLSRSEQENDLILWLALLLFCK